MKGPKNGDQAYPKAFSHQITLLDCGFCTKAFTVAIPVHSFSLCRCLLRLDVTTIRSRANDWERVLKKGRKTATDGGNCSDGKHCQRIVSEDELSEMLANGWMFVATLPSGKCVVSNET